jgi:hypothetical protein
VEIVPTEVHHTERKKRHAYSVRRTIATSKGKHVGKGKSTKEV